MNTKGVNVHVYPSRTFTHESRMQRISHTLGESGFFESILLVVMQENGKGEWENLDENRRVWRVNTSANKSLNGTLGKSLLIAGWIFRILWELKDLQVDCVNPHSVSSLPLGVLIKLIKRCKLVYDTHELETEVASSKGIRRLLYKLCERIMMPFADAVTVTTDGYAEWYRRRYSLKDIHVIRNYPRSDWSALVSPEDLRERFQIKENDILFLYHGIISTGRGIELLLRVFTRAPSDRHLVFMGYGDKEEFVRRFAARHPNIHFHEAVKPHEVINYIRGADVCLSLIEKTCLSYYHTLPNKVLESLSAGVPVIVSNFPDMAALVAKHGCGWPVEVNEMAINDLVHQLTKHDVSQKQKRARDWASKHSWEKQEGTLIDIYRDLLGA